MKLAYEITYIPHSVNAHKCFDILLTVHLNIFALILTNLMH